MNQLIYILLAFILIGCSIRKNSAENSTEQNRLENNELSHSESQQFRRLFHDANSYLITEDYERAFTKFNEAITIHPECAACFYQLSGLYDFQGRTSLAISSAKKASQLSPKNRWYLLQLAYLNQRSGIHEEAVKSFKQLVKLSPQSAEYYFPLAESQLYLGRKKEALQSFEQAETIIGKTPELTLQKHRLYLELGQSDKAIQELENLIEKKPNDVAVWGILAELYEEIGQIEKALETYEKILEIDPQNGLVHLSLYDYFRYHGNSKRAKEELIIAISSEDVPIDSKLQVMLRLFNESEGNFEKRKEAYDYLDIMSAVDSLDAKAHTVYADFLYRDGRAKDALKKYRKAIQIDPDHFTIWNQIMLIEFEMQVFEDMLVDSKKALEIYPTQPEFYFFNGLANIQLKKYEEAINSFSQGKELVIDNDKLLSEFHQNLGQANHELDRNEDSDNHFELALTYDPTNVMVMNNYSYYLSLRKTKLDRAAELSKRTNELMPGTSAYMDTYGWVLFQQENFQEAELWLKKAMVADGYKDGTILEHYGDVLFKLQKIEEAVEYWEKAKNSGISSEQIDKKITDRQYYE